MMLLQRRWVCGTGRANMDVTLSEIDADSTEDADSIPTLEGAAR